PRDSVRARTDPADGDASRNDPSRIAPQTDRGAKDRSIERPSSRDFIEPQSSAANRQRNRDAGDHLARGTSSAQKSGIRRLSLIQAGRSSRNQVYDRVLNEQKRQPIGV